MVDGMPLCEAAQAALATVLVATSDFEKAFTTALQGGEDVQIKLIVAIKNRNVKFVRLHAERNYELDET